MAIIPTILLVLSAASAPVSASADSIPEPNPSQMTRAEIRAHNAKLPKDHPYYIRCVKSADTGSLVARRPVCRTNAAWSPYDRAGEAQARAMADEARDRSASAGAN